MDTKKLNFNYSPYVKNAEAYNNHNQDQASFAQNKENAYVFQSKKNSDSFMVNNGGVSQYKQANSISQKFQNKMYDPNSQQKSKRIDFTDIIYQLSQPSNLETPNKEDQQQFLDNTLGKIDDGGAFQFRQNEIDTKESSLAISQLNEVFLQTSRPVQHSTNAGTKTTQSTNQSFKQQIHHKHHNSSKIHINENYLPQVNDNTSENDVRQPLSNLNINDMVNQLDDLQDHIKQLEYKLEYTSKNDKSHSKKKTKSSTIKKNPLKQSTFDGRENQASANNQRKSSRGKNISWGDSHVWQQDQPRFNGCLTQQSSLCIDEFKRRSNGSNNRYGGIESSNGKTGSSISILKNNSTADYRPLKLGSQVSLANNLERRASTSLTNSRRQSGVQSSTVQSVSGYDPGFNHERQNLLAKFNNQKEKEQIDYNNMNDLPISQRQILHEKLKEVEMYKEKCRKLKKQLKQTKEQLNDKDQLLLNYKNLHKELRTMKEQWRLSEDLRNEQKKQMTKLQMEMNQMAKENMKLKRKLKKNEEKMNGQGIPIKVVVEDKRNKDQSYADGKEKINSKYFKQ